MSILVSNVLPPGWADVFSPDHPTIGVGLDPATTTKATSNPSAITVTQKIGHFLYARLVLRFKTADPDVIEELFKQIGAGLRARGLAIRGIAILATNERFFAVTMRKRLRKVAPVHLLIESEKIIYLGEAMLYKAYLGNLFVNAIEDGYLVLPPEKFVKDDVRLVVRDRGTFDAELGPDGGHGDTFASTGASIHAANSKGGPAEAAGARVGTFGAKAGPDTAGRKLVNPGAGRRGAGARIC